MSPRRRPLPEPAPEEREQLRTELVARVAARHASWPQYANQWDDWQLGIMVERHYAHGATLADRGDLVLVLPDGPHTSPMAKDPAALFHTVHAERYGLDMSTRAEKVRVLT